MLALALLAGCTSPELGWFFVAFDEDDALGALYRDAPFDHVAWLPDGFATWDDATVRVYAADGTPRGSHVGTAFAVHDGTVYALDGDLLATPDGIAWSPVTVPPDPVHSVRAGPEGLYVAGADAGSPGVWRQGGSGSWEPFVALDGAAGCVSIDAATGVVVLSTGLLPCAEVDAARTWTTYTLDGARSRVSDTPPWYTRPVPAAVTSTGVYVADHRWSQLVRVQPDVGPWALTRADPYRLEPFAWEQVHVAGTFDTAAEILGLDPDDRLIIAGAGRVDRDTVYRSTGALDPAADAHDEVLLGRSCARRYDPDARAATGSAIATVTVENGTAEPIYVAPLVDGVPEWTWTFDAALATEVIAPVAPGDTATVTGEEEGLFLVTDARERCLRVARGTELLRDPVVDGPR